MHGLLVGRRLALIVFVGLASLAQAQVTQEKQEKEKAKAKQQPVRIPEGVKLDRDLEYARVGATSLKLDLYRPEAAGEPLPLVVWVHGGGWSAGSKENSQAVMLSGRGFAVASINYRL